MKTLLERGGEMKQVTLLFCAIFVLLSCSKGGQDFYGAYGDKKYCDENFYTKVDKEAIKIAIQEMSRLNKKTAGMDICVSHGNEAETEVNFCDKENCDFAIVSIKDKKIKVYEREGTAITK